MNQWTETGCSKMKAGVRFCYSIPRGVSGTTYVSETKPNPFAKGIYTDMVAYDRNGLDS